ncbi:MAG TPA: SCO family protein [Longimicrobium sp.]|nr:SCO family protein [Longimicrobium sp.]
MTKFRPPVLPMVLAIVAVLAGTAAYAAWLSLPPRPAFHGTVYEPAPAAEFRLADTDGRPVTLASLRGAPVLLFFGYTRCTDFCPLTLDRLSRAVRDLGGRAGGARIVFVTVDPANDTPDVLRKYVARFGPRVTALTGDSAALATAWRGYSVYVAPNDDPPATAALVHGHHDAHGAANRAGPSASALAHSGVVYGIDRAGNLRVLITEGAPVESMRDDIRTLAKL